MRKEVGVPVALVVALLGAGWLAGFQGWVAFQAEDYGFSMLIPGGTHMVTQEWGGGWGGLRGEHDGVAVVGAAKLGPAESAEEIERFGVEVTRIPAAAWRQIDQGSGNGWIWYRTVEAIQGSTLVFGGYGVGPSGSYMMLIFTTPSDFREYRSQYEDWYNSIRLY